MNNDTSLTIASPVISVGELANRYAASTAFQTYRQKRSTNTLRRQSADMALFCSFLNEIHYRDTPGAYLRPVSGQVLSLACTLFVLQVEAYLNTLDAWEDITHGLVKAFVQWQLQRGYAIGSVNVRTSTIRRYAKLAGSALPAGELALLSTVETISYKEGRHIDEKRTVSRVGSKKASPVCLSSDQVDRLKQGQPDTKQGARDTLLICLGFDHALRVGEIENLTLDCLNLDTGTLTFYREKVGITQTHQLTADTYKAAYRYMKWCKPDDLALNPTRKLIMGGNNKGEIFGSMTARNMSERIRVLCKRQLGVEQVSMHDGRHYCATVLAAGGTDTKSLQDIGGWSTPVMAIKYINAGAIANQGAKYGRV